MPLHSGTTVAYIAQMSMMKSQTDLPVFIADDDAIWTAILTELLKGLGYKKVHVFENGKDCLDQLNENPGIIFLDYQMDGMDGLKVLQKIKEYDSQIGVVFCTGQEDIQLAINAMKWGSFDFILKSNVTRDSIEKIILEMEKKQLLRQKVY